MSGKAQQGAARSAACRKTAQRSARREPTEQHHSHPAIHPPIPQVSGPSAFIHLGAPSAGLQRNGPLALPAKGFTLALWLRLDSLHPSTPALDGACLFAALSHPPRRARSPKLAHTRGTVILLRDNRVVVAGVAGDRHTAAGARGGKG